MKEVDLNNKGHISILLTPQETFNALRDLTDWADKIYFAYAWASSEGGSAEHWKIIPLAKIFKAIIGNHFAYTEPYVLRKLLKTPNILKVVNDTGGVFHPKVILGVKGNNGFAVLGSSNLTRGGFSCNTELNIKLFGNIKTEPLKDILAFIEKQWNSVRAFCPDDDWIDSYERVYNKRPKPPVVPFKGEKEKNIKFAAELDIPWHQYFKLISEQEGRTCAGGFRIHVFDHVEGSFLEVAEHCQAIFKKYSKFEDISEDDRSYVGGWKPGPSGLFGSMWGAARFKNIVLEKPDLIGKELNKIPLAGEITQQTIKNDFQEMFKFKGINIATATRLLCMKRPDYFIPVNGANKKLIKKIFGYAPTDGESYMKLQNTIIGFPWFQEQEPLGNKDEIRVWRNRGALLGACRNLRLQKAILEETEIRPGFNVHFFKQLMPYDEANCA